MTEVNNTNNTININLDATLGINDDEAGKLVQKLHNNITQNDGIEKVSYVNGQLEVTYKEGKEADIDALTAKLQQLAFSSDEMKDIFGEDIKNVKFKENSDGTITLISNDTPITKKITDFDIRELMKLLIAVFSELRTADRERALNILNSIVATFEQKIAQMEIAKQEQFKAAMATAIGQIAGGCITILGAGIGAYSTSKNFNAKPKSENNVNIKNGQTQINNQSDLKKGSGAAGQFFSSTAMSGGQIISGLAAIHSAFYTANVAEANIATASLDQALEVLKQAQEQYTKGNDSLQQFIDKVLNVMMQLLQSASQTEKAVANI